MTQPPNSEGNRYSTVACNVAKAVWNHIPTRGHRKKRTPAPTSSTIGPAEASPPLMPPPPAAPNNTHTPAVDPSNVGNAASPPRAPVPSLEQQAQLSMLKKTVDWGFRAFWGAVTLPTRVYTATLDYGARVAITKVIEQAASKGVAFLGAPPPETPLRGLRICLFELNERVSTQVAIDANLRQRAMTALDDFLAHQKKYLEESINPHSRFREGLTYTQESQFRTLAQALKENTPIQSSFVKPLYEFIDKCWGYQKLFHEKKMAQQLVGKITNNIPVSPVGVTGPTRAEKKGSHFFRVSQTPANPVPQNVIPLIVKELDDLKSLGYRIALALLVLPESSIHKSDGENGGLLAGLIKKSNDTLDPLKDPNEIFQNLLFTELDNSNLNFFEKNWRKFTCLLLAPSILFIIDHILDQSRDIVLYLIGLSPEERLKMVVKLFIDPGREFISKLQSEYILLSKNTGSGTTVDAAISNAITQIKIKDRHGKDLTPLDLLNRLVSSLLDKYAPAFNWSNAATIHFEKRAQQSKSPFFSLWFITWSYLSWAVNILSAPGRWCMNKIIRKILKTVAVSSIHSKLKDTSESSWDFGKLALHSIYKTLFDKLQKRNRSDRGTEAEDTQRNLAIEQTAFVDKGVQDDISRLVSSFLKLLYIQGSDLIGLSTKLAPNNVVEQTKIVGMELAFSPGIQKATEQIIQRLQIFLEEKSFSAGILEVIQDIHQQCLRFNTSNTDTSLARLENDFYVELQDAVKHGIQEIIDDKLDPSKTIQAEANLFIDGIRHDMAGFRTHFFEVQHLTPTVMKSLVQLRDKYLIDVFRRRCERADANTNPSARLHIKTTADIFFKLSEPIYSMIDDLVKLADDRKNLEEIIKDLGQLKVPLEKAIASEPPPNATLFYKELQLTLQKIKNKTYPPRVQKLISTLQGHFDAWKTEAAKKDNQTLLNGTIVTLTQAVQQAIEKNETAVAALKKTISEAFEQTKQLINALADWSKKLTHFSCITEHEDIDALKKILSQFAEEGLSPLIIKQLDAFFLFLGKKHNIKGILWYVIKAYLEMPLKSPKEFKKILDQVKSKLQGPLSSPGTPQ